ncbi:CLUMA_CG009907, isoform A [Clunio marinus]|uniref:Guanine nucleotide-binding protein-like 1 n=1 Tax=Clunio marinus TaxID=568069 RepID=A0A1J1I852_9DIPT|nr:CLUMA_CG009907, isoform A [Clunio marinus]
MPQGRRKIPFSGKQKKQQLINKRQDKGTPINLIRKIREETESDSVSEVSESAGPSRMVDNIQKINLQPLKDPKSKANRYVLQFHTESAKEIRELREKARQSLEYASDVQMEIDDSFFDGYDFPKRPEWNYQMSKAILMANEERYFFNYIMSLEKKHYDVMKQLSYCELNLETWRQLWRVLELSDIVLVIADARFPTLMFPPSLFVYVTKELNKKVIILLNKIDLVESSVVLAWKKYFEEKYKSINVVLFTSCPSYNLRGGNINKSGLKIRRRRGRMRMASEGALQVYQACNSIVKDQVDLSSWHEKIQEEMNVKNQAPIDDGDDEEIEVEKSHEEEKDFDFEEHVLYKNGVLTIGCIGFPNVGKSSLLNALMGKKVVSVSRTPGHTKHFQTIFLTNTVRLCDCPGLVFPSQTPRTLQVLMGSYPIAQLREPYGSVRFLAERLDIPKLLAIKHPEGDDEWSAMDICDAFALKRGFLTAKAARPDTYRAANSILRMALDGKITLSLKPKGFSEKKSFWENHRELESVKEIQALGKAENKNDAADFCSDSENESSFRPSDYEMKQNFQRSKNEVGHDDGDNEESESDEERHPNVSNPFDLLDNSQD